MSFRSTLICIAACFFLLTGCARHESESSARVAGSPITTPPQPSDPPALRMVRTYKMGQNLGPLAWDLAKSTPTSLAAVADKYGQTRASSVIAVQIQKLVPKYVGQWESKLADSYSNHLSQEELRSLADDGQHSPYAQKLLTAQPLVGQEMQANAAPIVQALATEAFQNALKDAP